MGCISESNLKPILPMQIIHSNSAKVWVLESKIIENEETAPKTHDFKTTYIFYNNGEFLEQKMVHLGSKKGLQGVYSLNITPENQDTLFRLTYKSRVNRTFYLKSCSSEKMILQEAEIDAIKKDNFWILKTLPKPSEWY